MRDEDDLLRQWAATIPGRYKPKGQGRRSEDDDKHGSVIAARAKGPRPCKLYNGKKVLARYLTDDRICCVRKAKPKPPPKPEPCKTPSELVREAISAEDWATYARLMRHKEKA